MARTIGTIVIILLIIAGIWWWASDRNEIEVGNDENATTTPGLRIGDSGLFVTDQGPGEDLIVENVTLKEGGYVAIHQDANGAPGNVIGVTDFLEAGDHEDIEVSLNREVGAGETLYAVIHTDNGDQTFSAEDDEPLMDEGLPVMVSFRVIDEDLGDFDTKL